MFIFSSLIPSVRWFSAGDLSRITPATAETGFRVMIRLEVNPENHQNRPVPRTAAQHAKVYGGKALRA